MARFNLPGIAESLFSLRGVDALKPDAVLGVGVIEDGNAVAYNLVSHQYQSIPLLLGISISPSFHCFGSIFISSAPSVIANRSKP